MNKYRIIALFGESAGGKDTIQKSVVSSFPDLKSIISCTTRPKRDYEIDGVDYHFLTKVDFIKKIYDGSMLETTEFRDWFYGTPLESLDESKINIGVFNIAGIECLLEDPRLDVAPIYISASNKTRLLRSLNREKNPDCQEICRRFLTDEKDFSNIPFDYEIFNNEEKKDTEQIKIFFEKVMKEF